MSDEEYADYEPFIKAKAPVRVRPSLFVGHTSKKRTDEERDKQVVIEEVEFGIWWSQGLHARKKVIGMLSNGYPTHWAYYLDDLLDPLYGPPGNLWERDWYLDGGTTQPERVVLKEDWKKLLEELKVI